MRTTGRIIATLCISVATFSPVAAETSRPPKVIDEALYCSEVLYALAAQAYKEGDKGEGRLLKLFGNRWLETAKGLGGNYGLRRWDVVKLRTPYKAEAKSDVETKNLRHKTCGKKIGM